MKFLSSFMMVPLSLMSMVSLVSAEDCYGYDSAMSIDGSFNTLNGAATCNSAVFRGGTLPRGIQYNIHFVCNGCQARYNVKPQYLTGTSNPTAKPVINNNELQFQYQGSVSGTNGASVESAIDIYIPQNYGFKRIYTNSPTPDVFYVQGEDSNTAPGTLAIDDWGYNGLQYYLKLPNTVLTFTSGQTNNGQNVYVEARVRDGSTFYLYGFNSQVSAQMASGNANVNLYGQSDYFWLQGSYNTFNMNGRDGRAYVNGGNGCNNVNGRDQNGNTCQATTETYSVDFSQCSISVTAVNLGFCYTDLVSGGVLVGSSAGGGGTSPSSAAVAVSTMTTTTTMMMMIMMMMMAPLVLGGELVPLM